MFRPVVAIIRFYHSTHLRLFYTTRVAACLMRRSQHQNPCWSIVFLYRIFHKSVKHFKNSQQINYRTDHGRSYADRERNSPSFFFLKHFTDAQCFHLWQYGRHLCDNPSRSTRVSAYHGRPEPQKRRYGCENL